MSGQATTCRTFGFARRGNVVTTEHQHDQEHDHDLAAHAHAEHNHGHEHDLNHVTLQVELSVAKCVEERHHMEPPQSRMQPQL